MTIIVADTGFCQRTKVQPDFTSAMKSIVSFLGQFINAKSFLNLET